MNYDPISKNPNWKPPIPNFLLLLASHEGYWKAQVIVFMLEW